jgi:hypothetical protein
MRTDTDEYQFLSGPDATVTVQLDARRASQPCLLIHGNRAGLLALANVLLWLVANGWRREFLSLAELPFVHMDGAIRLVVCMTDDDATGRDGVVIPIDGQEQYEWSVAEPDLERLAVDIHGIVANPAREYLAARVDPAGTGIEIRMLDVHDWL